MTDLHHFLTPTALSSFHQLPLQLRRHRITTNELLTWDATKVAKRCHVSPLAINKLKKAVLAVCGHDLGVLSKLSGDANPNANAPLPTPPGSVRKAGSLRQTGEELERKWRTISLLDPGLDKVMNGGVGVGQITEICGERYIFSSLHLAPDLRRDANRPPVAQAKPNSS